MLQWDNEIFYRFPRPVNDWQALWFLSKEGLTVGVYNHSQYQLADKETLKSLREQVRHEDFRFYDFRKFKPTVSESGDLDLEIDFKGPKILKRIKSFLGFK